MTDTIDTAPAHGWTCFHCDEIFTDPKLAAKHFGVAQDHRPGCVEKLTAPEKNLVLALRKVCDEFHRLQMQVSDEITNDSYFYSRLRTSLATIKPFKNCISLHDVFNVFDSMEGRALAAESTVRRCRNVMEANDPGNARDIFGDPADIPTRECPKCGDVQPDLDGFGTLHCQKCGYCKHASITDGVCGFCDKQVRL